MKHSAVEHSKFQLTPIAPARRVLAGEPPENGAAAAAAGAAHEPAEVSAVEPEQGVEPKLAKGPWLGVLLVLAMLCGLVFRAAGSSTPFTFTNDLAAGLTCMFYGTNLAGYWYYSPTNVPAGGTNTVLYSSIGLQGVAIQGTNSAQARLTPFTNLPPTGAYCSLILSNTVALGAGLAVNTTAYGTNILNAGSPFLPVAPGTNAVKSATYNTNLP